jgi:hypothetical protein
MISPVWQLRGKTGQVHPFCGKLAAMKTENQGKGGA